MGEDILSINMQKSHALIITRTKHEFQISVFTTFKEFSQQLYYKISGKVLLKKIAFNNLTCISCISSENFFSAEHIVKAFLVKRSVK